MTELFGAHESTAKDAAAGEHRLVPAEDVLAQVDLLGRLAHPAARGEVQLVEQVGVA